MRKVKFDPTDYPNWTAAQKAWWDAWSKRAQTAKDSLPNAPPRAFQSQVWRDLRTWLLDNFFSGKCAYCEINVSGGFFGEGEHFRPKNGVRVRNGGKLAAVTKSDGSAHDGYYWLAYDAGNLLPACDKCNNKKSNQFPIRAAYVFDPPVPGADIDLQEEPLLVHPCRDDPGGHLKFGVAGTIAALDDKGQRTIEVFGLDRDKLAELRKTRQEEARTTFAVALMNRMLNGIPIETTMQPFTGEGAQFSTAVKDYLQGQVQAVMSDLQN